MLTIRKGLIWYNIYDEDGRWIERTWTRDFDKADERRQQMYDMSARLEVLLPA